MFARLCKLCKCHSTCKHVKRLSSVGLATGTELNLWTIVILITRAIASPRRCLANSLRHPQVLGTKSSGLGTHRFRTASSRNAGDARQRNGDLWQARVAPGPVWRCDESERRVECFRAMPVAGMGSDCAGQMTVAERPTAEGTRAVQSAICGRPIGCLPFLQ